MQQLWRRGTDWDQPIPSELKGEWEIFSRELPLIQNIKIPRWTGVRKGSNSIELHGFCDASLKAYGAAVYLRVLDDENNTHMHLILAQTRVAPLSTVSLPRLELCGAVILATLIHHVKTVLDLSHAKVYAWLDSTITLAWIFGHPTKWTTFVSIRVSEIQRLTDRDDWRHIPTQLNPADLASRGISPSALETQDIWWKGPGFLRDQWKFEEPDQPAVVETEEKSRKIKALHILTLDTNDEIRKLIRKFSRLANVVRVLAYCRRFGQNCRAGSTSKQLGTLSPEELHAATQIAVRSAQQDMFSNEVENNVTIPKSLKSLNAFTDGQGIIRVGGRLQNTMLPYNQQHPIILHPSHPFTILIIRDAHEQTLHGGI